MQRKNNNNKNSKHNQQQKIYRTANNNLPTHKIKTITITWYVHAGMEDSNEDRHPTIGHNIYLMNVKGECASKSSV